MKTTEMIKSEQVRLLYKNTPAGIIATLFNSIILSFILWEVISHTILIIWFSAIISVSIFRCLLFFNFRHLSQIPEEVTRGDIWSYVSLVYSGVVWGSAGIFLFPMGSIEHQTFIAFVLGGMVAGASGTFSVRIGHFFAFSLPALVPVCIRFFMIGDEIHLYMGVMILLFGILIFFTAKRLNAATLSSLKLQFENNDLIEYLVAEKRRIEKLNKDYLSEINERKQVEQELIRIHEELECRVMERTEELMKSNEQLRCEIDKHKQTDKALRESEEKYRLLVDNATDAIFIAQDEVMKFPNPKTEEITGYSAQELARIPFVNLIHPEDKDAVFKRHIERINRENPPSMYSFKLINRTGKKLSVQLNTVYINWEGRPATLNFLRDITEQKELEDQLQRARNMEAIGTLAGGVAHDLNNILSGVVSYPELLLMKIPEDSPLKNTILAMRESGLRAASIVNDLLTLARRSIATQEIVNINEIISGYLKSPEYEKLISLHPFVKIEIDLDEDLLNTPGSCVHLSKAFMNLVSNAVEAIQDEGKIRISTKNEYIDRPISGYDSVEEGEYVTLTVCDNGIGISPQDIERIFEPFYTNKMMGRSGTGLGMSLVWRTIKDHNGYIDVQSTQRKGTRIKLYFPATREERQKEEDRVALEDYMGNGESILVVDDIKEQREIALSIFNALGYEATAVSSGEKAIEYLKKRSSDLILLDMVMDPGIDGLNTYKKILQFKPGQKAIIASGFSETDRVKETQRLGAGEYIRKPYTLEKIGVAVKSELKR
ncbi:MAG: ATP-binding protein [Thermodesulfobacteriota bacterium]|nr:ATP-binding protein [Thermodesulfobacteriota bacterium]